MSQVMVLTFSLAAEISCSGMSEMYQWELQLIRFWIWKRFYSFKACMNLMISYLFFDKFILKNPFFEKFCTKKGHRFLCTRQVKMVSAVDLKMFAEYTTHYLICIPKGLISVFPFSHSQDIVAPVVVCYKTMTLTGTHCTITTMIHPPSD